MRVWNKFIHVVGETDHLPHTHTHIGVVTEEYEVSRSGWVRKS